MKHSINGNRSDKNLIVFNMTRLKPGWKNFFLVLILALGGALRFWGISSGLPEVFVHDEIYEVKRALQLLRGEYDFYRSGKGIFYYVLCLIYAVYGLFMIVLGRFDNMAQFISFSLVHPGQVIFLSRATNAALGTLSIYLMYRIGCRVFNGVSSNAALLLAFAWSTCWLAVWLSTWGFVETCLVTLSILAFFPVLNIALKTNQRYRDYVLSGVIIAAATATKIYGAGLLLPLGLAHFFSGSAVKLRDRASKLLDEKLYVAMATFVVLVLLVEPSYIVFILSKMGFVDPSRYDFPPAAPPKEVHLFFYLKIVRWNIGNGMVPFLFVGLIGAILKRKKDIQIYAAFSIAFILTMGLAKSNMVYDRYMNMAIPALFMAAIYGTVVISSMLRGINQGSPFYVRKIYWLVIIAIVGLNGIESLWKNHLYRISFVPAEVEAKKWIEGNVPPSSRIILKGEKVWPGHQTVPLFDLKENYRKKYDEAVRTGRTFMDMEVLPDLARAEGVIRYDLTVVDRYDTWQSLDAYIDSGIEYFVIHVEQFQESFKDNRSQAGKASRVLLFQELQNSSKVTLLKQFKGMTIQGGPQTLEVYKTLKKGVAKISVAPSTISQ
jgi:hypothetical protein